MNNLWLMMPALVYPLIIAALWLMLRCTPDRALRQEHTDPLCAAVAFRAQLANADPVRSVAPDSRRGNGACVGRTRDTAW